MNAAKNDKAANQHDNGNKNVFGAVVGKLCHIHQVIYNTGHNCAGLVRIEIG